MTRRAKAAYISITLVVLVASFLFIWWSRLDPLDKLGIASGSGRIASGNFIEINVGERAVRAREILTRRGLVLSRSSNGGNCYGHEYDSSYYVEVYIDNSWRNGSVCVASKGGIISELSWFYNPFSP
jgi:hypothetical protein